jgi:FolB domain-containing protein
MNQRDRIVLEGVAFEGYCGITTTEREKPQPMLVDLEFECETIHAMVKDDISYTVDYAQVMNTIVKFADNEKFALLETMGEHLCHTLLTQFPISSVRIWIRKLAPPLSHLEGSVGVKLERNQGSTFKGLKNLPAPSAFLREQLAHLPKGSVLDLATGRGRNALFLASQGFSVQGVDRDEEALNHIQAQSETLNLKDITLQCLDLESDTSNPPDLGSACFQLIVVFFYLYRPLFPNILKALAPGGFLIYETFLLDNHLKHNHPRRKEFCLSHNELLDLTQELRVLHYDEGLHGESPESPSHFTARLLAQKESPRT